MASSSSPWWHCPSTFIRRDSASGLRSTSASCATSTPRKTPRGRGCGISTLVHSLAAGDEPLSSTERRFAMIRGMHAMFYCSQAEALRAFLRDKLDLKGTDVGGGWLIFDAPE